jgi:hypothetical protein
VYVFHNGVSGWSAVSKLIASDGAVADSFGYSVSIFDKIIAVGAIFDDTVGGVDTGIANHRIIFRIKLQSIIY